MLMAESVVDPAWMLKLTLDISKKIFPEPFTLTRAVLLMFDGTVIVWEPSFGVPKTSAMGNVFPPSVDK